MLQLQPQFLNIISTTVNNGATLFLDFSTSGAAGVNRIGPASTLTLGGAGGSGVVVNANAAATATHSQTFGAVPLNAGAHQIIANTNTNQNFSYTLGSITANPHAALNLAEPTAAGTGAINIVNTNNANGILGGWATYGGGDFAINNGSGVAAALATYTNNTWAAGNNTNITSNATVNAATTGTLRFNNGTAFKLDLTGTNTIQSGGLISAQQSPLITGGTLTSGTTDLITHVNGGVLRIASNIADGSAGEVTLVKALGGTLQLENNMSYTGGTVVGAGTIIVGNGPLGGSTGALGSGTVILSANNTGTGSYAPSGTLAFNRSGTYTVTNAANSHTGRTFVNEGILRVSGSGNIGTAAAKAGNVFVRNGEMIIQDDASVVTGAYASIGQRQGENGTLTVKGNGKFDIAGDFNVSDVNSKGTLNIADKALLTVKSLYVGKGGYSEGAVNQTGGTLIAGNTPANDWNIGGNGAGDSAAVGTYNLSGGVPDAGAQNFQTGRYGTGTLNISGSGSFKSTGYNVIGRFHPENQEPAAPRNDTTA